MALAEPLVDDDKRLFDAAVDDEAHDRWDAAREKLSRLAARRETAGVRFHLGHAAEKLGEPCAALGAFERAAALAAGDTALRERAEKRAAQARSAAARVRFTVSPVDATLLFDEERATSEMSRCVAPGKHRISARAAGYVTQSRVADLPAGAETNIAVSLSPVSAPVVLAVAPPRVESRHDDTPRWVALGAATAFGVASLLLVYEQGRLGRETTRVCAAGCDQDSRERATSRTRTGALATGAIAVVAGGVFVGLTLTR